MRIARLSQRAAGVLLACVVGVAAFVAVADEKYPSRPIEFIVPWGPGGGADQVARKSGKMMEDDLKVSFPVVNVPGATGNTGMTKLLAAQPVCPDCGSEWEGTRWSKQVAAASS